MKNLSIFKLLTLCLVILSFSGCNTIEGIGKDLKSAGGSIESSAKKKKSD